MRALLAVLACSACDDGLHQAHTPEGFEELRAMAAAGEEEARLRGAAHAPAPRMHPACTHGAGLRVCTRTRPHTIIPRRVQIVESTHTPAW